LEATTKKTPAIRKMPRRKWQAQTHRLMSNRRQTLKEKSGGEAPLLPPERFRLRRHLPATFLNGSLEHAGNQHLCRRPRRPAAGVEQLHDELLVRTTTSGRSGSLPYDRSTSSIL
jgi:hypothetical protein